MTPKSTAWSPAEDWRHIVAIPICHKNEGYRQTPTIENKVLQGSSSNFSGTGEPVFEKIK